MNKNRDFNLEEISNTENIEGGCFSYDVGWAIRASFLSAGGLGGMTQAFTEYAGHYMKEDAH